MNIKQQTHNIESVRDFIAGISVIKVKNKEEVLKTMDALEKLGLSTFTLESRKKFDEKGDDVKNNFMIKDKEGSGWRIQSHYIGNGFPFTELECLTEAYGRIISIEVLEFEKLKNDITKMTQRGDIIPQDIYFRYNELSNNKNS